jgi:hypothetical protein
MGIKKTADTIRIARANPNAHQSISCNHSHPVRISFTRRTSKQNGTMAAYMQCVDYLYPNQQVVNLLWAYVPIINPIFSSYPYQLLTMRVV